MQFLKTLLWIAVAVLVALFAIRNGAPVTVNLWSDLQMVTPLWVIVVLSFLAGLLPTLALHRASRWPWRRRLDQAERSEERRVGKAGVRTFGSRVSPYP